MTTLKKKSPLSVILLAAGASQRLGQPKQLVTIDGETILTKAIKQVMPLDCPIHVILGAHQSLIEPLLADLPLAIHSNPDWQEGMASSIRCGIDALAADTKAALIMLCDQPLIPTSHYQALYQQWQQQRDCTIVTAYADSRFGVPAIFPKALFDKLAVLRGDSGAKLLINNLKQAPYAIPCPEAREDVDTPQQLQKVLKT